MYIIKQIIAGNSHFRYWFNTHHNNYESIFENVKKFPYVEQVIN